MPTTAKSKPANPALVKFAKENVDKMFVDSLVTDRSGEYPRFELEELKMGKVLGKGGFGTVWEVRAFLVGAASKDHKKTDDTSSTTTPEEDNGKGASKLVHQGESRRFIANHCLREPSGDSRYAVKKLSPEVVGDKARFLQGMMDMAIETRFLSDIEHPNIIKLRAIAGQGNPYSGDYFLVMDRLYDTLEKRLKTWARQSDRSRNMMGRLIADRKGLKSHALYEDRIVTAFDLAAAVEYLHTRGILYRDLKPENIGFDVRDDVKIFDFGLAKELNDKLRTDHDPELYKLTEMTGSMCYMAPEVANGKPYNATCDSYSFAILLWQMLSLKVPFEMYTPKSLRAKVYNGEHKRPPIDNAWASPLKNCLRRSWTEEVKYRNTMSQITVILRKECVRCRDGDDSGLEHCRRRSTFVFRQ